ncbi:hypothetical protein GCM10029964_112290 [Kibdelosporangium lantanae]
MGEARHMHIRVGDPERNQAVQLLAGHFAAGRLSPAEHEDRVAQARAAVIHSDLALLFDDLPSPHPAAPTVPAEPAEETPLGCALMAAGVLLLFIGIPLSIILGFTEGLWWLLAPVGAGAIAAISSAEFANKRQKQD